MQKPLLELAFPLFLAVLCASCVSEPTGTPRQLDDASSGSALAARISSITANEHVTSDRYRKILAERVRLWDERKKLLEQYNHLRATGQVFDADLSIQIRALEGHIAGLDRESRKPFVLASQAGPYQSYVDACLAKIIVSGTKNYPAELRKRLYEKIIAMTFYVTSNGDIRRFKLSKSTGHKDLDDALIRAVAESSPCAPFSTEMAADLDFLHITAPIQITSTKGE